MTKAISVRKLLCTSLSTGKGQRSRSTGRFTHRGLTASGSCSGKRGKLLLRWRCARRCQALRRLQREDRGGGISWRPPVYWLLVVFWLIDWLLDWQPRRSWLLASFSGRAKNSSYRTWRAS